MGLFSSIFKSVNNLEETHGESFFNDNLEISKKTLSFCVWNAHKQKNFELGKSGFPTVDVGLYQESCTGNVLAYAFKKNGAGVGSSILTYYKIDHHASVLSRAREPFIGLRKASAVASLMWGDTQLIVASVHGLNRTSTRDFTQQVEDVLDYVQEVVPLKSEKVIQIVAGDFNTHNEERVKELGRVMSQHAFMLAYSCPYKGFFGEKTLDWVFVSAMGMKEMPNFKILNARSEQTELSDHRQIRFEMERG